jgi:hypothetical protein
MALDLELKQTGNERSGERRTGSENPIYLLVRIFTILQYG